jgi:hypothetical protein
MNNLAHRFCGMNYLSIFIVLGSQKLFTIVGRYQKYGSID